MMKTHYSNRFFRWYQLTGAVVLAFLSFPLHFLYDWLGENPILGVFVPIDESVWEHLKLAAWPTFLWWTVGYFIFHKQKELSFLRWFFASFFSLLLVPLMVVSCFYVFSAGLNVHSLVLDILSLYAAILTGQLISIHVYNFTQKPKQLWFWLLAILSVLFLTAIFWFTFHAPDLPMFISAEN